jgi:hypothetical protein
MVVTEVRRRLHELHEAESGSDKPKRKNRKPSTNSADEDPVRKGPGVSGPQPSGDDDDTGPNTPDPSTPAVDQDKDPGEPSVDGDQPDPDAEEQEDQDQDDAVDADGDNGEEPSGAVNDFASGKTVQAITIEPESSILPGAKEVVLTFNETTDSIRILVTPTGQVKFFAQGQLHDLP